ncbi:MAG TPA: hypothetical protein EYH39_02020 [Desulfurobacteriaceae bacterium]|nr:hypothetical protein [Desulfurobacteriaceae bacterium]
MKKVIFFSFLFFAYFINLSCFANKKNNEIIIYSDKAYFDINLRKITYLGNVLIISPYFNATCSKADIFFDKNLKIQYIYGYNNVTLENKSFYVKANFFFYDVKNKKLTLKGKVKITIKDIKMFKKTKKEILNAGS